MQEEDCSSPRKLVVFTANLAYSVRKGIVCIDEAVPNLQWLILVQAPPRTLRRLARNQWANLRRNGWRWIPYQMADAWQRVVARTARTPRPADPGFKFTGQALRARPNVRIVQVANLHEEQALSEMQDFAPDLGLSLAAPILRQPLFGLPRLGSINLHKGRLPDYRGMPPAFWELWNDEHEVGCSVHRVDAKLDTGEILCSGTVPRAQYSTLRGLQLRLDELGVDLMMQAVCGLLDGTQTARPQGQGGRTYRKPTLEQTEQLERRLRAQLPKARPRAVEWFKDSWSSLAWWGWRLLLRHFTTRRLTVLLYHRVADDARDNLTVGIEQFDRQMALLVRHCDVVAMPEVLRSASLPPVGARPLVAVTFDDGYLDNFLHAAPVLERHGLPASFFVSTGLIGTDRPFPHDVRRGNVGLRNMSWDQLRSMQAAGFEIGSHSVSHIDCAAEPEEKVRAELQASQETLQRELGVEQIAFAYPYGGQRHMTPARLALVKEQGYSACLSAYGGTNIRQVDRFNVLRRGVNWEFSDAAFLKQRLGL